MEHKVVYRLVIDLPALQAARWGAREVQQLPDFCGQVQQTGLYYRCVMTKSNNSKDLQTRNYAGMMFQNNIIVHIQGVV